MALPTSLELRIVTPERLLVSEQVDEVEIPVNCSATKNGCDRKRSILRARCTVSLSSSESSSIPRIAMMPWSSL